MQVSFSTEYSDRYSASSLQALQNSRTNICVGQTGGFIKSNIPQLWSVAGSHNLYPQRTHMLRLLVKGFWAKTLTLNPKPLNP